MIDSMRVENPRDNRGAGSVKVDGGMEAKGKPGAAVKRKGDRVPAVSAPETRTVSLAGRLSGTEGTIRIPQTEIVHTVRTLIALLDRNAPRQKALLSLLQLIRELPAANDGGIPDTKDRRLLQKVLKAWAERFGSELDLRGRSRLELLEKQLSPGQDESFYLYFVEKKNEGTPSRFSVEEKRTGAGKEKPPRLVLEMELPELGGVCSTLTGGGTGTECRIVCDSGRTRGRIRRRLPYLRERLTPFGLKELTLGRLRRSRGKGPGRVSKGTDPAAGIAGRNDGKGVHLWG